VSRALAVLVLDAAAFLIGVALGRLVTIWPGRRR
jgi:hypothetical protein